MSSVIDQHWKWTAQRYFKAVESGFLDSDERMELIDGELIQMAPMNPRHGKVIRQLNKIIVPQLNFDQHELGVQTPLAFSDDTWPEPDLSIFLAADYQDQHPSTALLVIEVANSSISRDQHQKLALYARHVIPEYWIVDIRASKATLWVYCDPVGEGYETDARFDGQYESIAIPGLTINMSDL